MRRGTLTSFSLLGINSSTHNRDFNTSNTTLNKTESKKILLSRYDILTLTCSLEEINDILDMIEKSTPKDKTEKLLKNVPKEVHSYFTGYFNDLIDSVTKNLPDDADECRRLKERVKDRIPLIVTEGLDELVKFKKAIEEIHK